MAAEYIKTKADLLRGVAHLNDDAPIQHFLNGVTAKAYFLTPGEEGGDTVIVIEPNYTCFPEKPAA
jgi:hypothetical protein